MEGMVFGDLTVVRQAASRGYLKYYLCRCSCGNEKDVRASALRCGHTKSCGCKQQMGVAVGGNPRRSIAGERFGRLVAVSKVPKPEGQKATGSWWLFRCDCGGFACFRRGLVVSGNTSSCGCSQNLGHPKEIAWIRFGRLTAICRTAAKEDTCYFWLCLCDCGNYHSVSIKNLTSGNTRSCGCLRSNSGGGA